MLYYYLKCVNVLCYLFQLDQLFDASSNTADSDAIDAATTVS